MRAHTNIDRIFLFLVSCLLIGGFLIFTSASLGLLAKDGARFSSVTFNQFMFGGVGGVFAFFLASKINYRVWKTLAPYLFGASVLLTLLVFVPSIGFSSGGATRWIIFGGLSLQPSEFMKIGAVIFGAALLSTSGRFNFPFASLIKILSILGICGAILLSQPNTSALFIILCAIGAMFFASGAKWREIFVLFLIGVVTLGIIVTVRPYVLERFMTFFNPARDALDQGFQTRQSLIAIGSGEISGRGFGQGVQKFGHLPEPIGDSIFAVAAEEFGIFGSITIIFVFLAFLWRTFSIAASVPDQFGGLLMLGLGTLITTQAFVHIGSLLGVFPLTGVPLPFVSHGGTSLLALLGSVGIMSNISKYRNRK